MKPLTLALILALASPAAATEYPLPLRDLMRGPPPKAKPQVKAWVRHAPIVRPHPAQVHVELHTREDRLKADMHRPRCYPAIRTVGDQNVSVDGAKTEAVKAWSQQARHDHGERAMDFEHSEHASFSCVRSSIGSVMGQVFHRCEVIARPCHPEHVNVEKK